MNASQRPSLVGTVLLNKVFVSLALSIFRMKSSSDKSEKEMVLNFSLANVRLSMALVLPSRAAMLAADLHIGYKCQKKIKKN